MKQFIFIAIALIFLSSLLPANLSCQFIVDEPVCNLGIPWNDTHFLTRRIGNDGRVEKDKKRHQKQRTRNFDVKKDNTNMDYIKLPF